MSISIQISKNGDWELLKYVGPINEDAELHLSQLLTQLGPKVMINFSSVANVNSCGVRAWINFMRDLQKGREIKFLECTTEIINQVNMIPNFRGNAEILSVFGDFTCPSCQTKGQILFKKGENLPKDMSNGLPEVKCPKCSTAMELDELEEEYFAWLDAA